jgi:hypothetical protein
MNNIEIISIWLAQYIVEGRGAGAGFMAHPYIHTHLVELLLWRSSWPIQ